MGGRKAAAVRIILLGQRARGAADAGAARDERPEPVIGVGDPLPRLPVEPGRELEMQFGKNKGLI